ncbi:MAG: endonuclease [Alcaligenaceae bacterium]|nr:endonuclease [Alcaligenaceae bacterium]
MNKITIQISFPDSKLMPNRKNGRHWGSSQEAKIRAKQEGFYAAKSAFGLNQFEPAARVPVSIRFYAPDNRNRDLDNLLAACKPAIDGIAHALGVDDKHFRPITVDDGYDKFKRGFVIVEIG